VVKEKFNQVHSAAWYLIVAGLKVAEADGTISDREVATLQEIMQGASKQSKSAIVRQIAHLATDVDSLQSKRSEDKRSLIRMTADLSDYLEKLPVPDRMRYLGLLVVTVKEVATSTGGGWFRKRSLNDNEIHAATGLISAIAGGVDPNIVIDWVEANGY